MEAFAIIVLIIFILTRVFEFLLNLFANKSPPLIHDSSYNPMQHIVVVNDFIRKEVSIEILKWLFEGRLEKNPSTFDSTFVMQITNGEEIKRRTSIITNIVSSKISPEIHAMFNRVYRKNLARVDKTTFVDISLQEYIARYIFFMLRKLVYDITVMVNGPDYNDKRIDDILNMYIMNLEESIYKDSNIFVTSPSS